MAELNIKRVKTGVTKDAVYVRGDIINIEEDGFYDNHPHLTVLKVPGLKPGRIRKLLKTEERWKEETFKVQKRKWNNWKTRQAQESIDDKPAETVIDKEFKDVTSEVDEGEMMSVTAKRLVEGKRRRFRLPAGMMNNLFPEGVYRATLTKAQFLNRMDNIIDKADGDKKLSETNWYSTFKGQV